MILKIVMMTIIKEVMEVAKDLRKKEVKMNRVQKEEARMNMVQKEEVRMNRVQKEEVRMTMVLLKKTVATNQISEEVTRKSKTRVRPNFRWEKTNPLRIRAKTNTTTKD